MVEGGKQWCPQANNLGQTSTYGKVRLEAQIHETAFASYSKLHILDLVFQVQGLESPAHEKGKLANICEVSEFTSKDLLDKHKALESTRLNSFLHEIKKKNSRPAK